MTNETPTKGTESINNRSVHQGLTPEQQEKQQKHLEPMYNQIIGEIFEDSASAVERCRELCAEFGFTVKQESSAHRNIYVFCSREGLPDSLRNPKANPQRNRPSKRCDCRWRIVLYENPDNKWEFRKSLNPEAGKHNHELMNPDEIERSWPKAVTDLICELTRQRMSTQDVRTRVRDQFPNLNWNERRFYNRLSEERQKIKLRDSIDRTHQLNELWTKVCMASAGNDDLFQFVKQELALLLQAISETSSIDINTLPPPHVIKETIDSNETSSPPSQSSSSTKPEAPKGYLSIEIPKQICYIKIHNQKQLNDTELLRNQRRFRTLSEDHLLHMFEPPRKMLKKGKDIQSSVSQHHDQYSNGYLRAPMGTSIPGIPNIIVPIAPKQNPHVQPQAPTFVYYDNNMEGSVNTSESSNENYPLDSQQEENTQQKVTDSAIQQTNQEQASDIEQSSTNTSDQQVETDTQKEQETSNSLRIIQHQPSLQSPTSPKEDDTKQVTKSNKKKGVRKDGMVFINLFDSHKPSRNKSQVETAKPTSSSPPPIQQPQISQYPYPHILPRLQPKPQPILNKVQTKPSHVQQRTTPSDKEHTPDDNDSSSSKENNIPHTSQKPPINHYPVPHPTQPGVYFAPYLSYPHHKPTIEQQKEEEGGEERQQGPYHPRSSEDKRPHVPVYYPVPPGGMPSQDGKSPMCYPGGYYAPYYVQGSATEKPKDTTENVKKVRHRQAGDPIEFVSENPQLKYKSTQEDEQPTAVDTSNRSQIKKKRRFINMFKGTGSAEKQSEQIEQEKQSLQIEESDYQSILRIIQHLESNK